MRADGTAPHCGRCGRRHLVGLPCWAGRYAGMIRTLVLDTYGDDCCHCGLRGARSVEHVHPRSHGGTDALENLRPAHLRCNTARGTDPMAGWGIGPLPTETSPHW